MEITSFTNNFRYLFELQIKNSNLVRYQSSLLLTLRSITSLQTTITMAQTSMILQIITIAIHVLAIIFLVITIGLFGDAHKRYNDDNNRQVEQKTKVCFLYISKNNYNPSISNCNFSIAGEVLAALGLVILVILSVVKIVRGLIG